MTEPKLLLEDALVFVADNDAYAERVELLLRHGVDPDGRGTRHPALRDLRPADRGNERGVELLARIGYDVNHRDGQTALHVAAYAGNPDLGELLVELEADPTIRDASFGTPAADWAGHSRHDQLAAWLDQLAAENR